jgi:hypothetical protein
VTSERDDSRLVEYLYGELSADEARAYERSLADDGEASADARALASVLALAREVDPAVDPPSFLDAKIMAAARAQAEAQVEATRSRGWRRWLSGSSVGGALIAVAASALVVLNLDLLEPRIVEPTAAPRAPSPQREASSNVVAKREAQPVGEPPPPAATAAAPIAPAKEAQEAVEDAQRELRSLELRGALAKDADRADEGGGGVGVGGLGASRARGAGSAGSADKRTALREEAAAERESPDPDARSTGARRQAGADSYAGVDAPAEAPAEPAEPAERAKSKQLSLAEDEASKGELDDASGAVAEKKSAKSKSDAVASVASGRDDDGAVAAGPAPARKPAPAAPAAAAQAPAAAAPPASEASAGDALAPKGSLESGRASVAGGKAGEVDPGVVRAAVAVVLSNAEARIRAGDLTGARRELLEGRSRWGSQPGAAVLSLRLARLAEQQGQAAEARRWAQEALARTQDDGVRREAAALLTRVR